MSIFGIGKKKEWEKEMNALLKDISSENMLNKCYNCWDDDMNESCKVFKKMFASCSKEFSICAKKFLSEATQKASEFIKKYKNEITPEARTKVKKAVMDIMSEISFREEKFKSTKSGMEKYCKSKREYWEE